MCIRDSFDNPEAFSGGTLILGAVLFSFQIYGDFSGYSDIAIGTAKLFGFELMTNFKFPYFSRDIAEFWRRWHISLSTWFRDYLYIPLGGSRVAKPKAIRNVFVIFLVSGFWHGANWTFIVWGGIHALLFIPLFLRGTNRKNTTSIIAEGRWLPSPRELLQMGWTFTAVTIALVFFRADSLDHAATFLAHTFTHLIEGGIRRVWPWPALLAVSLLIVVDFMVQQRHAPKWFGSRILRMLAYGFIGALIAFRFEEATASFIYFQF